MSAEQRRQAVMTRVRWVVVILLFTSTVINYMDRQILGLLKPDLSRELGWSETDYSSIVIAFQIAYAIGQLACGPFIEWVGTKFAFSAAIVVWSLAAMAHGVVRGVTGFMSARFTLALGESLNFPAAIRTVAEWFPKRERAFASGLFNSGSNVGAVFAPLLVPLLARWFGWRGAFVILGAAGFVWLAFWLWQYQPLATSNRVNDAERAYIRDSEPEPETAGSKKVPWRGILSCRATWAYVATCVLVGPVWWFYLFWLPDIFHKQFGLDMAAFGPPLVVVYAVTAFGSIAGGWLSLRFMALGMSLNAARKIALLICASCTVSAVIAGHASHVWVATLCFSLAAAGHQGWSANMWAVVTDLFPKEAVAAVVGFGGTMAALSSVVFSWIVGRVLQDSGAYGPILVACGCAYLLALLIFHVVVPKIQPLQLRT